MRIEKNADLARRSSFRSGGKADTLLLPQNVYELTQVLRGMEDKRVYGLLSNTLVSDGGVRGKLALTVNVRGMERTGNAVTACCGDTLSSLALFALSHSLTGAEFCYGIPGTVGGGVFMNAGAYGGEIKDILKSAVLFSPSGEIVTLENKDLGFGYRASLLQRERYILLKATFELEPGRKTAIRAKMKDLMARRREKQPLEFPSCGSVFKRPEGHFAGALIEQCGLKGARVGGAEVSQKHAGFIINAGGATTADMLALTALVKRTVKEKTGVELEEEIRILGET